MKNFVTALNKSVTASPLKSSSILSFILVGLEKLVDINFECPCDGGWWNGFYFLGFLLVPAGMACVVMLIIERDSEKKHGFHWISTVVPPLVWFIMVFLDGEYINCAVTYRTGIYVKMEGDPTHRWCKPLNNTEDEIQLLLWSKKNIVISQITGIVGLIGCGIMLLVYYIYFMEKSKTQDGDSEKDEKLKLRCSGHVITVKVHKDEEVTTL